MKLNFKRPIALLLSFAMLAGGVDGALSLPALAADATVNVHFVDEKGGNPSIEATRMVGEGAGNTSVNIGVTVGGITNSSYSVSRIVATNQEYDPDPPPVSGQEPNNAIKLASDKKTVTIAPDTNGGIYNIAVRISVLGKKGYLTETFIEGDKPTPPTPAPTPPPIVRGDREEDITIGSSVDPIAAASKMGTFFAEGDVEGSAGSDFLLASDMLIDQDSSLKFKIKILGNNISFDGVSGTETFKGYDRATLDTGRGGIVDKTGGGSTVYLRFEASDNSKTIFYASFDSARKREEMTNGSTFDVKFEQPATNSLTLKLKSPKGIVEEIANEISNDSTSINYIKFLEGDRNNYVTGNIELLHKRVIDGMKDSIADVIWRWEPENSDIDLNKNAVRIPAADSPLDWYTATVTQPETEDIKGDLVAFVTYTAKGGIPVESTECRIPIVIKKRGELPSVETVKKWVLKSNANGDDFSKTEIDKVIAMDCYNGEYASEGFPKDNADPYEFSGKISSGSGTRFSNYVVIKADTPDVVTMRYNKGKELDVSYDLNAGAQINFEARDDGDWNDDTLEYYITGKPDGTKNIRNTKVTFSFYRTGKTEPLQVYTTNLQVRDTSPSIDTKLRKMELRQYRQGNLIDNIIESWFGTGGDPVEGWEFNPIITDYRLRLSYKTEKVDFRPFANSSNQKISVTYPEDPNKPQGTMKTEILTGDKKTSQIPLADLGEIMTVKFTVESESKVMGTYTFDLIRRAPSDDANLKELHVFDSADATAKDLMTPPFSQTQETYKIDVPYQTDKALISTITNDIGASIASIKPDMPDEDSKNGTASNQWVPLKCDMQDGLVIDNKTEVKIEVIAEDGSAKKEYIVNIYRNAPKTDTTLKGLKLADGDEKDITTLLKPAFDTKKTEYSVSLPYETDKMNFTATLDPLFSSSMLLSKDGKKVQDLKTEVPSKTQTIEPGQTVKYAIRVTAEDGITMTDYIVNVTRTAPKTDATLSKIDVVDDAAKRVGVDEFDPSTLKYTLEVDYKVESVTVTPTPTDEKIKKLTVNGKTINIGNAGAGAGDTTTATPGKIKLNYPNTTVTIQVTAEDGKTTKKYILTIKRKDPSNDARLKSLTIDKGTLTPTFVPSKFEYAAEVEATDNKVTIVAIPNEENAKITIDGKEVKSGEAYLVDLVEVKQTVTIVVTAQDGKTTKTYTITFTNKNLIKKSANADLKSLKITKGEVSPIFKPSTLDYSVYATESTAYVDLYPVPSDPQASVKVMAGSLQIGDYNGNFSQTIVDGENEFTIEVTASDGVTIKTYTAMVYRNDEENMGSLTPLTVDDIDFETESPIISSDITKRPRVNSEIFQELQNYPDKTLVLQGNDYSLQFASKDLNKIIPDAVNYDFGMKFSADNEAEIMDEINSYSGNQGLTPVYVDFTYHGELPGKATYTLSLGKQYANRKLYFHYYNEERGRIDYYGYVTTNSQGTFSVPLSRLGTFIITPRRIAGSENKALVTAQASSGADAAGEGVDLGNTEEVRNSKINPDTGIRPAR